MRLLLGLAGFLFCAGLCCIAVGNAQLPMTQHTYTPSPAAGYTGPGDVVSGAKAWYGLRAYSAAVAATGTQKSVNIRRNSDNATSDILILTSGAFDSATATTFCAATTCQVVTWYDQIGTNCGGSNCDVTQATAGNQPEIFFTGGPSGSNVFIRFNSAHNGLGSTNSLSSIAPPYTLDAVVDLTSVVQADVLSVIGTLAFLEIQQSAADSDMYTSSGPNPKINSGVSLNTWYTQLGTLVGEGSGTRHGSIYMNALTGTATSASAGATLSLNVWVGSRSNNSFVLNGGMVEAGIWPSNFSSTQAGNLDTNQHSYWGF